jgi:hypothetical protein
MMRIKMVLETLVSFIHLMLLIVQEDFTELSNYVDTYVSQLHGNLCSFVRKERSENQNQETVS